MSERRTIVFIDESGLFEQPRRVRTWAPIGRHPPSSSASTGRSCRLSRASPVALLASACAGSHPHRSGHRLPRSAPTLPSRQGPHHLGQGSNPPQSAHASLPGEPCGERIAMASPPPMPPNSIRWNASGPTGWSTNWPTSARRTSGSSVTLLPRRPDESAAKLGDPIDCRLLEASRTSLTLTSLR